jgi:hypothetical protein
MNLVKKRFRFVQRKLILHGEGLLGDLKGGNLVIKKNYIKNQL